MSQTMRITEINGAFYPEIFTSFPDRDDAIALIEYAVKDAWLSPSDEYEVVTEWYEIGEGESNSDTFFADETLIDWYNKEKGSWMVHGHQHQLPETLSCSEKHWDVGLDKNYGKPITFEQLKINITKQYVERIQKSI